MNILVTGGAGFIGSHLVERLLDAQHNVIAIDNFDPFYDPGIKEANIQQVADHPNYRLERQDILDYPAVEKIFRDYAFELVIHLAAKAGVRPSIRDPLGYQRANIEGTLNLLELCKEHGVNKFIFASSSSVYGNNKKVPFAESDNVDHPVSPYAATKKAGELICYNYYHLYDISTYCLRFFTVYGPRQRPEMAIHKFTRLIDHDEEIPVYGYGKPERDFTYIDDIIHGLINAVDKVTGFEVINLGESKTISVNALILLIEQSLRKKAEKKMLPLQPGDVQRTYADITKARKLLGYNPQTDVETGIRKFVEWYWNNGRWTIDH